MTETDLPQLSLQRYFDLVKRRRWQLLPVTLLGLVVGGLIALLIPRYYVAETWIVHNAIPGQQLNEKDSKDPFTGIVQSARDTIPLACDKAVESLKWPEAKIEDWHERQLALKEIRDRVDIFGNPPDEKSNYARIGVYYRDLDGNRAANLANAIVRIWLDQRIEELRAPADDLAKESNDKVRDSNRALNLLLEERQVIAGRYGVDIGLAPEIQRSTSRDRIEGDRLRQRDLVQKRGALVAVQQRRDRAIAQRDAMPDFVPFGTVPLVEGQQDPQLLAMLVKLQRDQQKMESVFREGTEQWRNAKRSFERTQKLLGAVKSPGSATGEEPNPQRKAVDEIIDGLELERAVLEEEIGLIEDQLQRSGQRLIEEAEGLTKLAEKNIAIDQLKGQIDVLNGKRVQAETILAMLQREQPVKQQQMATPPPRPTDPNILVVALVGSVLGLLAAIGLILLIDLLQGSFKTTEDVERGLAVPVLGGVSYLETEEQRKATVQGRQRASLVAFAAVAMVVIVVTIYYVDPTRLPTFVRDGLAVLLGK
jgi:capsular polysaccharide biosynthesis protein